MALSDVRFMRFFCSRCPVGSAQLIRHCPRRFAQRSGYRRSFDSRWTLSCLPWLEQRVVALRVGRENIFHVRFDGAVAAPLDVVEGPPSLPFADELFGICCVKAQAAAAQRDTENPGHFAQPNQRRHQRLDIDLEQLRLETLDRKSTRLNSSHSQ